MRTRADKVKTELRRERYERFLAGDVDPKPTEQRIAEARAKREAAQRIGTNNSK